MPTRGSGPLRLLWVLFMNATDTKLTEVPYDGTGPAMEDLVGSRGRLHVRPDDQTTEQITAGTVKPCAITSPERNEALPDVPTTSEAGLPDVQVGVATRMYVPRTRRTKSSNLTAALRAALKDQNVIDQFAALGTGRSRGPATPRLTRRSCRSRSNSGGRSSRRPASRAGKRHGTGAGRPRHRRRHKRSRAVLGTPHSPKDVLAGLMFVIIGLGFASGP